jgi:hypothetical protein
MSTASRVGGKPTAGVLGVKVLKEEKSTIEPYIIVCYLYLGPSVFQLINIMPDIPQNIYQ